jgi:tripartite-type tricarboxylate transporter receptor subunit TctC
VHIPYKGIAPAMTDLVGGQVSVMFPSLDSALPHIRSGKIKALAVTSTKRSALLPQVPTVDESGLPGFEIVAWGGVLAPAGTPKDRHAQQFGDRQGARIVRPQKALPGSRR